MEQKEIKQDEIAVKKKSNKGLLILVVILVAIILGMGLYIAYDKEIIFSNVESEEKKSNGEKETKESNTTTDDNKDSKTANDNSIEIKNIDLSKCLNNSNNNTYSNSSDVASDYGLSMEINSDKKSITLSINWTTFGPLSGATLWADQVTTYQITDFSKDISDTFVGELGQDSKGITLFYLMSDGTVEYTPMFNKKFDSQNNLYYDMNYTYEYSSDGKVTGQHFTTKGTISGVSNVVKLYTTDVYNGAGWKTTVGATKDGSFYDLGTIINNG